MSTGRAAYKLLVESRPIVVLDVETCPGAGDEGDHIISIAAVTCRQGRQRSTWSTVLDPGVPITNSQFHGLTDADVAGARTFAEVVGELEQALAEPDVILICHNVAFDVGHLHLEYERLGNGAALPDVAVLDTMRLPTILNYQLPGRSRRLAAMCEHFGVTNSQPHNAAADAAATAEVLHKLLRIAADAGHDDLTNLHRAAGGATTRGVAKASKEHTTFRSAAVALPPEHIATHTKLLPKKASVKTLDRWAADALECARLRCHLLGDKARTATAHAPELHRRLTAALATNTFEPGQGAALVEALNILAPAGLDTGKNKLPVVTWWRKHRQDIFALPRCSPEQDACPPCRDGDPCPLDVAHHHIAATALLDDDGWLPLDKRKRFANSRGTTVSILTRWLGMGLQELAGFGAWLVIDAWLTDRNPSRAERMLDDAITAGATDPRLATLYAQRLAAQGRDEQATAVVQTALATRNTDPGFDELKLWFDRWQAQRTRRPCPLKTTAATSPRRSRPPGRTRARRYAL